MDVLITGSSGFVGTNLLSYFDGIAVSYNTISRADMADVDTIEFNHQEAIIHLAGKAHDLKQVSNPQEYQKANYELTKELYNAFLKSDVKKFIFISSVKAAADEVSCILTEDFTANPKTEYGKSKLMAEDYIQSQPLPEGKSYYILRPCMIHGPQNKGNLNLLYQFIKKGIPYPLADFDNKRSYLSVKNLCFVISELVIRNDIKSGIFQVADDEPLSTNTVVSILASSLNLKPKLWGIPAPFIKFLARVGDVLHLPLTTERLNKLTENYVVSNLKIKTALNKELPLNTIDGLKVTANSFNAKN